MLELKGVTKIYPAAGNDVHALKGIDLAFRKAEFVAILGQSGCGKTTMLNIIGGLDRYTEGDLRIGGVSTKDFRDRDWDAYRNHSVGFVFQSYNLIPHQTVLSNVELALTLSGVSKAERRQRAKKALESVGLGDQLKKKPAEMSGGQMQRVAIARAIVNDPDIILADEPTGALDSETSVQVMEILKEISRERLVIMVTHNPELAETYATRTVRMLDGCILSDSAPLSEEEYAALTVEKKAENKKAKEKKPSMSFGTSFGLSLNNLFTKKGRTALTSFAGSIGIIGIALIFAISQGMTTYIDTVQEETLSSYPLTLQSQHMDLGSLLLSFQEAAESTGTHEKDAVYQKAMLHSMMNALNNTELDENDLAAFKTHIESEMASDPAIAEAINGVQYSYDLNLQILTKNVDGDIIVSDTTELLGELMAEYMGADMAASMESASSSPMASMMSRSPGAVLWQEMLPGDDGQMVSELLQEQYELVYGTWPDAYNEVVLVLDQNNELDDMTLYALGLLPREDIDEIMDAAMEQKELSPGDKSWSYKEICDMEFRAVLPSAAYTYDDEQGIYTDLTKTDSGLRYLYSGGEVIKVSGIIRLQEDALSGMLTGSIGYTSALTEHIITAAADSAAAEAQKADPKTDIFTGLPFEENTGSMNESEKEAAFRSHVEELDEAGKAAAYVSIMSIPSDEMLEDSVAQAMDGVDRQAVETILADSLTAEMGLDREEVEDYLADMEEEELMDIYREGVEMQVKAQYAAGVAARMAAVPRSYLAAYLDSAMEDYTTADCAKFYDEVLVFSEATYEDNLVKLGCLDLADPSAINLYAASFEEKDIIEDFITAYNDSVEEMQRISYTDYVGLMMSSVTTIINAITYVLIAFVSISLVVSSIMIGVITLISVQERTKEIGILRAIGASKRNVSGMFNAETVIIGFTSGLLGVVVTYLLCIPINAILHSVTGIGNLDAILPVEVAVLLVLISMVLTLFAGIIPSRSAAKKDPVVALRTE